MPQESCFALVESEIPQPGPGDVLVRSHWLSLDPYMRGRMSEARSYAKPTEVGEPMTGQAVGEVTESSNPRFAPGDVVVGQLGWQEHAVARGGSTLRKVDPSVAPIQTALHVLGVTGLTAYFGLFDVGVAKPGDTVVVSGAAGAVGQIVGQLAKLAGCSPVVGIAGGPEKKRELTELYGYDTGIDYKSDDVNAASRRLARTASTCTSTTSVERSPRPSSGGWRSAPAFRSAARSRSTTWPSRSSRRATSAS